MDLKAEFVYCQSLCPSNFWNSSTKAFGRFFARCLAKKRIQNFLEWNSHTSILVFELNLFTDSWHSFLKQIQVQTLLGLYLSFPTKVFNLIKHRRIVSPSRFFFFFLFVCFNFTFEKHWIWISVNYCIFVFVNSTLYRSFCA